MSADAKALQGLSRCVAILRRGAARASENSRTSEDVAAEDAAALAHLSQLSQFRADSQLSAEAANRSPSPARFDKTNAASEAIGDHGQGPGELAQLGLVAQLGVVNMMNPGQLGVVNLMSNESNLSDVGGMGLQLTDSTNPNPTPSSTLSDCGGLQLARNAKPSPNCGSLQLAQRLDSTLSDSGPNPNPNPNGHDKPAPFLSKLLQILEAATEFGSIVHWEGTDGPAPSFVIVDTAAFSKQVLPQFFKHN